MFNSWYFEEHAQYHIWNTKTKQKLLSQYVDNAISRITSKTKLSIHVDT